MATPNDPAATPWAPDSQGPPQMSWSGGVGPQAEGDSINGIRWDAGPGPMEMDSAHIAAADPSAADPAKVEGYPAPQEYAQQYAAPPPSAYPYATQPNPAYAYPAEGPGPGAYPAGTAYPPAVPVGGVAADSGGGGQCCGRLSRGACIALIIGGVLFALLAIGGLSAGLAVGLKSNEDKPSPPQPRQPTAPAPFGEIAPEPSLAPTRSSDVLAIGEDFTSPAAQCTKKLSDAGVLFSIDPRTDNVSFVGPCFDDNEVGFGTCTDRTTGDIIFKYCSAECRAEVAEVDSDCQQILIDIDAELDSQVFTNLFDRCTGRGRTNAVGCGSDSPPSGSPPVRSSSPPAAAEPSSDASGATPGGACAAALADLGALYQPVSSSGDITEYQPAGPCTENDAFGQCINSSTGNALFDFCSDACRADLAKANSTCRGVLGNSGTYFPAVLQRCNGTGSNGDDCGSGSRK